MRLTLIISSLGSGGAERVLSTMANYWAEHGHGVTVITLDSKDSDFYALLPQVQRVGLALMQDSTGGFSAVKHNLKRLMALCRSIRRSRPEAVISFMDRTNVLTLLATRGLKTRIIVSERVDPSRHDCPRVWSWIRLVAYPWADCVVCQTDSVRRWMNRHIRRARIAVIPNPVSPPQVDPLQTASTDAERLALHGHPTVAAMGRLTAQKGFDLLISAFAGAVRTNPAWRLVILGDGPQRDQLILLARSFQVQEKVSLPGILKNPFSLLRQADIFVLPSRYEGFPNALLEAMACGLPVVSFDCPSGPADIIRHGVDGLLVPAQNVDALARAMAALMNDEKWRSRLSSKAVEVAQRFSLERVMGMWEPLLNQQTKMPYHERP